MPIATVSPADTWIAVAPTMRNSRASVALMMPPTPTIGMVTAAKAEESLKNVLAGKPAASPFIVQ